VATTPRARADLIRALDEVSTALIELARRFDDLDLQTRDTIKQVEGGATALSLAASMGLPDRRDALNAAVERVRKGRHEFLRTMFLLALEEGSSRAEIARVWHVSRQLVSRMTGEEQDS
jgi:plasmid stabilization system protein ParE